MIVNSQIKKVAVIGLGNIATRHRRNLKYLFPAATVYAMSASGRNHHEIVSDCDHLVSNLDELVALKVDFVIVASPAPFHVNHTLALLEANIPTLIEKPVTTTLADAKKIKQFATKYQTPVSVGYCLRYLPSAQKLRGFLAKDKIGVLYNAHIEIGQYLPDWRPSKDYRESVSANKHLGGGALFELSHELDYAQWLLGPLALQHATLRSTLELGLDVEDIADIMAVTSSNAVATIHLDFLQRKAHRRCSFVGSKGRIDWCLMSNQLIFTTTEGIVTLYHDPEWDKNQMYLLMLEDFVQMIQGNSNNCISLDEATSTVSLIDEIKRNACTL
ncbi:Gfo/Idh/MocA family oxidoreductase [Vibrio tubiashii]|uniref:Gfo/Idh/MocA family protein n=1 Tax=Vibrio tubiashii TaxID=29498 RepID=UPI001EFE3DE9|nr:Gfo/Idh/MocA family oxidoreductase [Vibrio tubiashii]MCG9584116.1 Gfo/Idh/MocA family oxidoreductase [Vibrio tubiashii]MCG9617711.1 Gfo/Idh/MocA family oxidoreductase [Vibrio tubiashii]MCG9687458.1 Gfo/Idh/MocA family oxidoreductase [Vibrio tubiashii]